VNAPARDPSDLGVAHGAEPALERPEKAKSPRTLKRFRHMVSFAFFEVGLMGRIVWISGACAGMPETPYGANSHRTCD
jgi:hypothetical protein